MRPVRDLMETDVFWVPSDMPLLNAASELTARGVSGAPVCDPEGHVIGMLTKTDLVDFYGSANEDRFVTDAMTPEVLSVAPDDAADQAVRLMAFEGVHRLLVIEEGHLVGIVSSMDILRELAGFPRSNRDVPIGIAPPER
ncbi:MAG: CBS domain-containing protein [Polyangiaceae bacterium]